MTDEQRWVQRLARSTPDTDPSYQRLTGGWWMLHGKVYPVPKPPLSRSGHPASRAGKRSVTLDP